MPRGRWCREQRVRPDPPTPSSPQCEQPIEALARDRRVYLSGASATAELAAEAGAQYLAEGPIEAAGTLGEAVRQLQASS